MGLTEKYRGGERENYCILPQDVDATVVNCCAALKDVVAYVKVRSVVLHVNNVGIGVLTQDRHTGIHHHLLAVNPTLDISSEDAEDELSSDELSTDEELVTDETDINDPDIQQII